MSVRSVPRTARLRWLARRQGVPERDAADLAQEALARDWEARRSFEPSGEDPQADKVLSARARLYRRSARARTEVLTAFDEGDPLRDDRPDPEGAAIQRSREELARRFVDQIKADRRAIFIDHVLRGVPIKEVAVDHAITEEAARKRLRAAWEDVHGARARWQAEERRRGRDGLPALVLPAVDLARWIRRARRLTLPQLAAAAVVAALAGLPIRSSPSRAGPLARLPLPAVTPASTGGDPIGRGADDRRDARARDDKTTTPAPTPRPGGGQREDRLVGHARALMDAGQLDEAARLLGAHAREFPDGRRAAERKALMIRLQPEAR